MLKLEKNSSKMKIFAVRGIRSMLMFCVKCIVAAICTLSMVLFTGCKKEVTAPPPAPSKKISKPVQAPVTTVQKEEYVYNAIGKRDPFRPFIELEKKGESSKVPMTPLQAYDVSDLKLVGIILLPGKSVAMIEDPSGKGYNVRVGVSIGRNEGKVVEILKEEVIVEEKLMDEMGLVKVRRVSITMPKEKEGEVR